MSTLVADEIEHEYRPRGSQRQLFKDRRPEIVMAGPAGTGKTRACLEKVHWMATRYPGSHHILVRKTLESLKTSALVVFIDEVIAEALDSGFVREFGGSRFKPPQFEYDNGSKVLVGGMDKPGKVMSSYYDSIYVNEATELDEVDWDSLATRRRHYQMPWQQTIADCNPAEQTHWLKLRCDQGRTYMYHTTHRENPVYFYGDGTPTPIGQDYVLGTLAGLTGIMRARYYEGLWVAAEGVIYTAFDPAIHIIDRFEPPLDWPRYWAIDWGMNHPFVWQDWAEDFDGNLYLVREIYMTGRTVPEHCRLIKRVSLGQPRPQKIVVDHQKQERVLFEQEMGMRTTLAHKDVLPGIHAVQQRFKDRRIFYMRGALVERDIRLRDLKLPGATVEEIPGYVWLDKDREHEGPTKKNDHGRDAERYLIAELDVRPKLI